MSVLTVGALLEGDTLLKHLAPSWKPVYIAALGGITGRPSGDSGLQLLRNENPTGDNAPHYATLLSGTFAMNTEWRYFWPSYTRYPRVPWRRFGKPSINAHCQWPNRTSSTGPYGNAPRRETCRKIGN